MWTSEVNADSLLETFSTVVEADVNTKGSWKEDFDVLCEKYGVIPCPMIQCITSVDNIPAGERCRVTNAAIDISSWRVMLLACCTVGNKVKEIVVHNSTLTHQHLKDLALALKRSTCCQILKLQYLDFINLDLPTTAPTEGVEPEQSLYTDALQQLFSDDTCLQYISLRGNKLTDAMFAPFISSLTQNLRLNVLNLSDNRLTDKTSSAIFAGIRRTTNLKEISFSKNHIRGDCLVNLQHLLLGTPSTADDEATVKAATKSLGDRNKAIKELNKKRKKAGWAVDIPELVAATDCIAKRDGANVLVNRSLRMVDFSLSPLLSSEHVSSFVAAVEKDDDGAALPPAAIMTQAATGSATASFSRRSADGSKALAFDCIFVSFSGLGWLDADAEASTTADAGAAEGTTFRVNSMPKPWLQLLL